jgi:hypothetical protein
LSEVSSAGVGLWDREGGSVDRHLLLIVTCC